MKMWKSKKTRSIIARGYAWRRLRCPTASLNLHKKEYLTSLRMYVQLRFTPVDRWLSTALRKGIKL